MRCRAISTSTTSFLATVGVPHLIRAAPALGPMAWPDVDMTVVCDRLDLQQLSEAAAPLVRHSRVRQLTVRYDTGV